MLPLHARVDLGTMAMNGYSVFPKAPALLIASPIRLFNVIHVEESFTSLQRYNWCILQSQPIGLNALVNILQYKYIANSLIIKIHCKTFYFIVALLTTFLLKSIVKYFIILVHCLV